MKLVHKPAGIVNRRQVLGAAFALSVAVTSAFSLEGLAESGANQAQSSMPLLPGSRVAGEGVLRVFGLKIYEARVHVIGGGENWERLPLALELTYARAITGEQISKTSMDEIARLGLGTAEQRRQWASLMGSIFPDVKAGDTIVGIYRPNEGAQFYLNKRSIGSFQDTELSRHFFSIWLSEKTRDRHLRAKLLANLRSAPSS